MERNKYHAINSEKTNFMKHCGADFLIHGLFVDDMMHVTTSDALRDKFMKKYTADFKVTSGGLMETFLGMEFIQSKHHIKVIIKLHLGHCDYVSDLLLVSARVQDVYPEDPPTEEGSDFGRCYSDLGIVSSDCRSPQAEILSRICC